MALPWVVAAVKLESTLVVVTGASRGFGRALAESLAHALLGRGDAVVLALLARDAAGLAGTRALVEGAAGAGAVRVVCGAPLDFADLDAIEPAWAALLAGAHAALAELRGGGGGGGGGGGASFHRAVLVNNAGSLGDIAPIAALPSVTSLRAAVDANVTACAWLTHLFAAWLAASPPARGATVVNVSSLAAVKPFPSQLVYCLGKAARDMLHAGLALELAPAGARVLSYAPGPLETDMQAEIRAAPRLDAGMRGVFEALAARGQLIAPRASADVCARLVLGGAFENGAHVDYYDCVATDAGAGAHAGGAAGAAAAAATAPPRPAHTDAPA